MSLAFLFGNIIDTVFFISIIVGIVFILLWYVAAKIISRKIDKDFSKKEEEIKPFEVASDEIKPFEVASDEIKTEDEASDKAKEDFASLEEENTIIPLENDNADIKEESSEYNDNNSDDKEDIVNNEEANSSYEIKENEIDAEEVKKNDLDEDFSKIEEINLDNKDISLFDEDESDKLIDDTKENSELEETDVKELEEKETEVNENDNQNSSNEDLKKPSNEENNNNVVSDNNTLDDVLTFDDVKEDLEAEEEKKPLKKVTGVIPVKKGRSYNGKYEIFQVADGYQYRLKASNGEILVQSETFISHDGVLKAIDAVKRNLSTGDVKIFMDKHDQYKFKLTSKNYRVLAISGGYSVEKSAVRASESFKKFAFKADIVDIDINDVPVIASTIDVKKESDKDGAIFIYEKYGGEYSWSLVSKDNKILCQDEGYTTKNGVLYAIDTFKRNVASGVFKCISSKDSFCFRLYNQANRVCAIGETYKTKKEVFDAVLSILEYIEKASLKEKK